MTSENSILPGLIIWKKISTTPMLRKTISLLLAFYDVMLQQYGIPYKFLSFLVLAFSAAPSRSIDGELAPTSVSEMVLFHGYRTHTFGGAANFSEADRTFVAPFNEGRSDVLKARNFIVGGKIRFYIHWTEANFGTTQVDGDRLLMHITGTYKVYGLN